MRAPLGDQVADSPGEHSSLARACPGNDEYRAALVQHRLPLWGIQALEQSFGG
jgi:hypothetical protein